MITKAQTALKQAEEFFSTALEELARPAEDIVPYAVCRNSFLAVNNFLIGYLLQHGKEIHAATSLKDLLTQCQAVNQNFHALNLLPMYHNTEGDDLWMDFETMNTFMDLARQTRTLVAPVAAR